MLGTQPPPPSIQARQTFAVDIALAALVGEGVYNFGEGATPPPLFCFYKSQPSHCSQFRAVSAHPILASLSGSPNSWLADLMRVYQAGSIDGFNSVVSEHRTAFEAQPALAANISVLKEKIALLAVMELASTRPGSDRSIPVAELSRVTRLPGDQVEWLVMRALSLGLIKGSIDEVSQVVHFTYVRPRVLDDAQVSAIRDRIEDWRAKAHKMLLNIEDNTTELFK
jgi:26S proteasome regulatory subunit N9